MSAIAVVRWTLAPIPVHPVRPCPRCGAPRPHRPTGRARLNANGRRLDAWLLYVCVRCERTLKVPVFERQPVSAVPAGLLRALEANDPAVLARLALERLGGADVEVRGDPVPTDRTTHVVLEVPAGVRVRLDRVLALGLPASRSEVRVRTHDDRALKRPARDGQRVVVWPLQEAERAEDVEPGVHRERDRPVGGA